MTIKYRAILPSIEGVDLLHPSHESAEHEIKNARKAGYDTTEARIEEVMLRGAA